MINQILDRLSNNTEIKLLHEYIASQQFVLTIRNFFFQTRWRGHDKMKALCSLFTLLADLYADWNIKLEQIRNRFICEPIKINFFDFEIHTSTKEAIQQCIYGGDENDF